MDGKVIGRQGRVGEGETDDMKSAATVTIKAPGAMTPKGRKDIADWLRQHADDLERDGKDYVETGSFRGRYAYE